MDNKSPFVVLQEFLSPLQCQQIIGAINYNVPDKDKDDKPLPTIRTNDKSEDLIFERVKEIIPALEYHYGLKYQGTERPMMFEWYTAGMTMAQYHCGNSVYGKGKWIKTKNRDLSGIIFLSDYNDKAPFDDRYETFGGNIQFPQHGFTFNPERGTAIIYPSYPHFLSVMSPVQYGNSHIVRFHIAAGEVWFYDPKKFPGDYRSWFEDIA